MKNRKRWTAADCLRMRAKCRELLHVEAKNISEEMRMILFFNFPPIDLVKLGDLLEKRHPEYSEKSLRDIVLEIYGQEALDFVMKYAGMEEL